MAKRVIRKKTPTQQIEELRLVVEARHLKENRGVGEILEAMILLKDRIEKLETRVYALEESVSLRKVREGLTNDQRVMAQNPQIAISL